MKSLFLLPLLLLGVFPKSVTPPFVDPTGTYILKGEVKKNRITGHSGEIRARLLDQHKVAFCLYMNNGYPEYASGAMIDTLNYEGDRTYYHPANDSSCFIVFIFKSSSVELMEVYSDPHSGCGFPQGIMIPSIFDKSSSDIPVIQDLSKRGLAAGGPI
jgi:hypothetical protein